MRERRKEGQKEERAPKVTKRCLSGAERGIEGKLCRRSRESPAWGEKGFKTELQWTVGLALPHSLTD